MREYLKKLRQEAGLTMLNVADAFGISKQYYEMIESGERQRKMDVTMISKIADLFGVSVETVVAEERAWLETEPEEATA